MPYDHLFLSLKNIQFYASNSGIEIDYICGRKSKIERGSEANYENRGEQAIEVTKYCFAPPIVLNYYAISVLVLVVVKPTEISKRNP